MDTGNVWPEGAANPQFPAMLAMAAVAAASQSFGNRGGNERNNRGGGGMEDVARRVQRMLPTNITPGAIGVYCALPITWILVHVYLRDIIGSNWNMPLVGWSTKAPHTLLTHIFVHASDMHLLTNMGGYVLGCVGAFAAIKKVREVAAATFGGRGNNNNNNWGEQFTADVRVSINQPDVDTHTAKDAVVTITSALFGGILGGAVGTAMMALYQKENFVNHKGFGWGWLDDHITRPIYSTLKEETVSCLGGSDVVSGLMGFVQGALGAYSSLGILLSTDVLWILMEDVAGPPPTWGSCLDRAMKVGHAAHVGGAIGGFAVGIMYRAVVIARRPETRIEVVQRGRSGDGRGGSVHRDPFAESEATP